MATFGKRKETRGIFYLKRRYQQMVDRCESGYSDIDKKWLGKQGFLNYAAWLKGESKGESLKGMTVDKDFMSNLKGIKPTYGPDTCILLTKDTNIDLGFCDIMYADESSVSLAKFKDQVIFSEDNEVLIFKEGKRRKLSNPLAFSGAVDDDMSRTFGFILAYDELKFMPYDSRYNNIWEVTITGDTVMTNLQEWIKTEDAVKSIASINYHDSLTYMDNRKIVLSVEDSPIRMFQFYKDFNAEGISLTVTSNSGIDLSKAVGVQGDLDRREYLMSYDVTQYALSTREDIFRDYFTKMVISGYKEGFLSTATDSDDYDSKLNLVHSKLTMSTSNLINLRLLVLRVLYTELFKGDTIPTYLDHVEPQETYSDRYLKDLHEVNSNQGRGIYKIISIRNFVGKVTTMSDFYSRIISIGRAHGKAWITETI